MNGLLKNNIVNSRPTWDEATLVGGDNTWKDLAKTLSKDFGNNFIAHVTQGNGS